jgi:hypothetical protein
MKFTIDRKTWLRGEGEDDSALLREYDNKMCCLGGIARQCGITGIVGELSPAGVEEDQWDKFPEPLRPLKKPHTLKGVPLANKTYNDNSDLATDMMKVNDDEGISDEEREAKLKELCAPHGIELEFTD